MQWLVDVLKEMLNDLLDALIWVGVQFVHLVLSGLAALLEAIPVPAWLSSIGSYTIPASVQWLAAFFEIPFGLSIVVGAYVLRFVIRRIPLIG